MITFPENTPIPADARIKFGIDPTFPRLHLGHLVPLRVVKKFILNKHPVTIVLGTFTAQLGDPSGRDTTRPILNKEETKDNARTIMNQIRKILPEGFLFWENHGLHHNMDLPTFMREAAHFSVAHMMSRDAFQKRQEEGNPIGLHELLVPICQGLDSVHLETGAEIGGQDQLFNFQVARELQVKHGQKPQACIMCPIIRGTDGRKMSKSLNNCIWLDDEANEMFGKVMSISDEVMDEWIPLLSDDDRPLHPNPMKRKMILAHSIVRQCHDTHPVEIACGHAAFADKAWQHFESTVQNKEAPNDIPEISASNVIEAVAEIRKCSKNEARRLLGQKGVKVDGTVVDENVSVQTGQIVQVGHRSFGRIK